MLINKATNFFINEIDYGIARSEKDLDPLQGKTLEAYKNNVNQTRLVPHMGGC
jgi:hypothetical protein